MDQTLSYADILTRLMRDEEQYQPMHGPQIVSVCDTQTNQFMLIAVGWQKDRHVDSIVFHARLLNGLVVIETDNTEEGLTPLLIEAGIPANEIVAGRKVGRPDAVPLAA